MNVIVISSPHRVKGETQKVQQLFEAGMEKFHLRKPKYSAKEIREYLDKIDEGFLNRIMIHSHHELCVSYPVKGIHYTEKHRAKKSWRNLLVRKYIALRRPDLEVSTGFHAQSDLIGSSEEYSYVFLSPVFPSISKVGHTSTFNEESLRLTLSKTKYNVFALGGVDEDKIETARDFGFRGVALLGSIWKSHEPVEKFNRIKSLCNTTLHTF